ncbi:PAS domain-containing protein [Streptomyces sp. NPDC001185]|uniref:SpoIIE family protein phosphatase n=1 Tax=Streptomyces sp. NPDC001185 TaxID=3154380 RepID=UPI00332577D5
MLIQGTTRGLVAVGTSPAAERQSSAKLRQDAEVVMDQRGVITHWSAAAQDLLGYTESEMRGRPASSLLSTARHTPSEVGDTTDGACDAPVLLRCRDGRTRACTIRIRPAPHESGGWRIRVAPAPERPRVRTVDEAVLEALFSKSPTSLCVYDTELHLRRYNPAAGGKQGVFTADSIGLSPHELWPESNSKEFETCMAEVLESGTPVIGFEKRGRPPGDPGHEHVFTNSVFRLEDHAGHVMGLATTSTEITEQRIAEDRIRLLADASTLFGTSLDMMETGQQLADLSVPRFADATAVDVLATFLTGRDADHSATDLRRIGLRHRASTTASDGGSRIHQARYPFPPTSGPRLAELEPHRVETVLPHDDGEPLYPGTSGTRRTHALVVPMKAHGDVVGVVTFYRLGLENPFSDFDVLTARDLAARAALSIDNARRYTHEHSAVRALQRELLPHGTPEQSAVRTAHFFAPASAGANWFDVIPMPGARVALVLGTTSEAGLSGAAAIGRLGTAVHTLTDMDLGPEEVLSRLDLLVTRISAERGDAATTESDTRVTCVYAIYDPISGRLSVASAGHPLPRAAGPDGRMHSLGLSPGEPLGSTADRSGSAEIQLPAGSTLAFCTPGFPGDRSLTRALSSAPAAPLDEVKNDVVRETQGAVPPQGAVLLLARTLRLGEDRMASWNLPSDPAVVATARQLVDRQLADWGMEEAAFVTELVVSELVTNAIRYTKGPIQLRLIRDRALICEVSDASTVAPRLRFARTGDEGGRGLYLIAQLTQRWGTRFGDDGKTIWTEQDMDGDL